MYGSVTVVTSNDLYQLAQQKGHAVYSMRLSTCRSFTVEDHGCHIALAADLSATQEKEALAHELGHCEYGGFYNRYSPYDIRAKAERRADKWSFLKLVPPGEIKAAVRHGLTEVWELADAFNVSCEYMQRALGYYRQVAIL